jgi:hypothetical protein
MTSETPSPDSENDRGPSREAWAERQARVSAERGRWDISHEAKVRAEREIRAVAISQESRLTPTNIWRRLFSSRGLTTLLVFGLLLSIGVIPAGIALRTTQEEGIDPSLIRRIQVGLEQKSDLDGEGFDLLELVNGGELLGITSTAIGEHGSDRLQDGLFDPQFKAWRSADHAFPITLTFKVRFRSPVQKVIIWNHPDEPTASYIKELQVLASLDDPRTNPEAMVEIGRFKVPRPDPKIVFNVETPVTFRFAVIRILSTFGRADYVSASELALFGPSRDPEQIPVPRSSGPMPI